MPFGYPGVTYKFSDGVDLSFTKGDNSVQTKSEPSGSGILLDSSGLKKITITGVSGGSTAELVALKTGDADAGFPETDTHISIGSNIGSRWRVSYISNRARIILLNRYESSARRQRSDSYIAFNDANDPSRRRPQRRLPTTLGSNLESVKDQRRHTMG